MTPPKVRDGRLTVQIDGVDVLLYSVADAASVLDVSPTHVYRLIDDGKLSTFDGLGRGKAKTRIRSDELVRFIDAGMRRAPARRSRKTA